MQYSSFFASLVLRTPIRMRRPLVWHPTLTGGCVEQKIGLTAEGLRNLASKLSGTKRRAGLQATEEFFDSAVQEVVDETNIPRSALGEAVLSGIVRQGNSYGAPTAGKS